jgi:hypothetical protein
VTAYLRYSQSAFTFSANVWHLMVPLGGWTAWKHIVRAIEAKYADAPRATPSMSSALKDLDLAHLWVLYPGDRAYPLAANITVLPIASVREGWEYPNR